MARTFSGFAKRILLERNAWLSQNRINLLDDESECLDAVEGKEIDPVKIAFRFDDIAQSRAIDGANRLVSSRPGGWQQIHLSWAYQAFYLLVFTHRFDSRARPKIPGELTSTHLLNGAYLLGYSLGVGNDRFATWWGNRLLKHVTRNDSLFSLSDWRDHKGVPVESFMVNLFALWTGASRVFGEHPAADLGFYNELLKAWDDGDELQRIVDKACNFHSKDADKDDFTFSPFPMSLIPFEIWALLRVRRDLGLETPPFDHPLLKTPFAIPPDPVPELDDYLLNTAIERCQRLIPELSVLRDDRVE